MKDVLGYQGKKVVITGAATGMGASAAELLVELGAEVHALDIVDVKAPVHRYLRTDMSNQSSIDAAVAEAQRLFGPDVVIEVSGIVEVISTTMTAVLETMLRSYATALAVITPLMVILIGRLGVGLLAMIPNLVPVTLTLGVMGWLDIPLDAFTLMVGSVAIGLAVDDTIHLLTKFTRARRRGLPTAAALREALFTIGNALTFTTLILVLGFAVLAFSQFAPNSMMGKLAAVMIGLAWVADFLVTPAILALLPDPNKSSATDDATVPSDGAAVAS